MKQLSELLIERTENYYKYEWECIYKKEMPKAMRYRNPNILRPSIKLFYLNGRIKMKFWSIFQINDSYYQPYMIQYRDDDVSSIEEIEYFGRDSIYKPVALCFGKTDVATFSFWDNNRHNDKKVDEEINEWIKKNGIVLTKNNDEIPDEFKAEFKLLFG